MASNSIESQIAALLDDYSEDLKQETDKVFSQVAKESASELRRTSPRGKGKNAGAYASGWTVKREKDKSGLYTVTVHNKDHYQLTHLLEHGHALPQGGRADAKEHIAPVANQAREKVVQELEQRISKI